MEFLRASRIHAMASCQHFPFTKFFERDNLYFETTFWQHIFTRNFSISQFFIRHTRTFTIDLFHKSTSPQFLLMLP